MRFINQFGFYVILILCSSAFSCQNHCDCYGEKDPKEFRDKMSVPWNEIRFNTDSLRKIILKKGIDPLFGWHIKTSNKDTLLSFMTKDKILIEFDLEHNYIKSKKSLSDVKQMKGSYIVNLICDTLFLLKQNGNVYYKYLIGASNGATLIDSFDIGASSGFKNSLISFAIGRQGAYYKYPFIYYKYGINSKKNNFIDKTAYLQFNTLNKTMRKMIKYPECYHCSRVYLSTSSMAILNNGQASVLFDSFDALFFLDQTGNLTDKKAIIHKSGDSCKMLSFDESQHQNLAYVRKYLAKNEVNIALLKTPLNQLIAIQKKGKNTLYDESVYNVYVFDSSHNQVYTSQLPYMLSNVLEYKNGMIALNDSLNKAYYYDFKN